MSTTVLPELAAESTATAERLGHLSAEKELDAAEAEYIFAAGVAAIERVFVLWRIVSGRIGKGMPGSQARQHLTGLLDALDKNLALAATLRKPALVVQEALGREPKAMAELVSAEERLRRIQAEALHVLRVIDVPPRWPTEEQLREAKGQICSGEWVPAEQLRQP